MAVGKRSAWSGTVVVLVAAGVVLSGAGAARTASRAQVSEFAWSPDGTRLAVGGDVSGKSGISTVEANDSNPVYLGSGGYPTWSPDGTRIAFNSGATGRAADGNLWVMASNGSGRRMLEKDANEPAWSPDGKTIVVWATERDNRDHLKLLTPSGHLVRDLAFRFLGLRFPFWSPDGRWVEFYANGGTQPIYAIRPNGKDLHVVHHGSGAWSPDRRSVAYVTARDRHGKTCGDGWLPHCVWNTELYVRHRGGAPQRLTFDRQSDSIPTWSPNGKWIAFVRGPAESFSGALMAIHPDGSGLRTILG
jgi:Tol biopolymer transport system component